MRPSAKACSSREKISFVGQHPTCRERTRHVFSNSFCRLIIGPNRVLDDREVETANQAFYRTLFETFDGVIAHRAMNDAIAPWLETRPDLFYAMSAEQMFFLTVARYFDDCRDDATIERRIDERIDSDLASGKHPELADPRFRAGFRDLFRAELTNHRKHFEHYRRLFFFCDLQPENCSRFNITFEQCWSGTSRSSAQ